MRRTDRQATAPSYQPPPPSPSTPAIAITVGNDAEGASVFTALGEPVSQSFGDGSHVTTFAAGGSLVVPSRRRSQRSQWTRWSVKTRFQSIRANT